MDWGGWGFCSYQKMKKQRETGNIQNNTTNHFVVVNELVRINSYVLSGHLFVLFLQKEEESSESNFF